MDKSVDFDVKEDLVILICSISRVGKKGVRENGRAGNRSEET